MAFDAALADRVRAVLDGGAGVTGTRMFGSLAFLLAGNMACCVSGDGLLVEAAGLTDDGALRCWVDRGAAHARSLPAT